MLRLFTPPGRILKVGNGVSIGCGRGLGIDGFDLGIVIVHPTLATQLEWRGGDLRRLGGTEGGADESIAGRWECQQSSD